MFPLGINACLIWLGSEEEDWITEWGVDGIQSVGRFWVGRGALRRYAPPTEERSECGLWCYRTETLLYTSFFSLERSWPPSTGQETRPRQTHFDTSTLRMAAIAIPLAYLRLKTGSVTPRIRRKTKSTSNDFCCGYGYRYVFTLTWTRRSNSYRGADHAKCEQADCSTFLPSRVSGRY